MTRITYIKQEKREMCVGKIGCILDFSVTYWAWQQRLIQKPYVNFHWPFRHGNVGGLSIMFCRCQCRGLLEKKRVDFESPRTRFCKSAPLKTVIWLLWGSVNRSVNSFIDGGRVASGRITCGRTFFRTKQKGLTDLRNVTTHNVSLLLSLPPSYHLSYRPN